MLRGALGALLLCLLQQVASEEAPSSAVLSEQLRRLVLTFSHPHSKNQSESRRGYGTDEKANAAGITACRARLQKAGADANVIKEACISNAGGDTLLANREFYDLHLNRFATMSNVSLLCIGIFRGESLAVWSDWFSHGRVVGLDVNLAPAASHNAALRRKGAFQHDNVQLIETDTTTASTFNATLAAHAEVFASGFDVVIDDGCHTTGCIVATFDNVIPLLKPGGVYLVEDNDEHLNILRRRRQWASFAFKEGEVSDGFGTPGSSHHTFLSAFHLPRESSPGADFRSHLKRRARGAMRATD